MKSTKVLPLLLSATLAVTTHARAQGTLGYDDGSTADCAVSAGYVLTQTAEVIDALNAFVSVMDEYDPLINDLFLEEQDNLATVGCSDYDCFIANANDRQILLTLDLIDEMYGVLNAVSETMPPDLGDELAELGQLIEECALVFADRHASRSAPQSRYGYTVLQDPGDDGGEVDLTELTCEQLKEKLSEELDKEKEIREARKDAMADLRTARARLSVLETRGREEQRKRQKGALRSTVQRDINDARKELQTAQESLSKLNEEHHEVTETITDIEFLLSFKNCWKKKKG